MKPGTLSAIVVSVLVIIGGIAFIGSRDSTETTIANTETTNIQELETTKKDADTATDTPADKAEIISLATVAAHNSGTDCWTIVAGSVYDITSYVPRHPGGVEILRACGADGTTLFTTRTAEDGEKVGSGTSHSSNAASILSGFKIGELAI